MARFTFPDDAPHDFVDRFGHRRRQHLSGLCMASFNPVHNHPRWKNAHNTSELQRFRYSKRMTGMGKYQTRDLVCRGIDPVDRSWFATAASGINQDGHVCTFHQLHEVNPGHFRFDHLGAVAECLTKSASRQQADRIIPSQLVANADNSN